jgi:hypothetical protein
MRFFRRESPTVEGGDFWAWWTGASDRIARAIETGGFDAKLVAEITRAVHAVDPRLAWEFAPGHASKHALCVSPEGDAEVRPAALRWLASAPAPDATWEYHAARQASPKLVGLEIGGVRLDLGAMRALADWDPRRRRVDVRLWHAAFLSAAEAIRVQASFLFLDKLLGEDDVERWIGRVDATDAASGGGTPAELKSEVERRSNEPATDTWVLGQRARADGSVEIVMADVALKHIDHPFADQHVTIRIPIEGGGMPDGAMSDKLNREEDRLAGLLPGVATLAGRTTAPGERVIHFVTHDLAGLHAGIDAWAQALPPWRIKVVNQRDPRWAFQRELGIG